MAGDQFTSLISLANAIVSDSTATSSASAVQLSVLMTIFVLAVFVGVEIITKIPPTLHTPLMSGSNAISGITLIGAVLATGSESSEASTGLGFLAVVLATMNVVGGFMVTNRMLGMFKPKKRDD